MNILIKILQNRFVRSSLIVLSIPMSLSADLLSDNCNERIITDAIYQYEELNPYDLPGAVVVVENVKLAKRKGNDRIYYVNVGYKNSGGGYRHIKVHAVDAYKTCEFDEDSFEIIKEN